MEYSTLIEDLLKILNHFKQTMVEFLPNLVGAVFIFFVGFLVARVAKIFITRFINKLHLLIPNQKIRARIRSFIEEKPITKVIGGILYWILIFFFLTVATETLGLPVVTTWLSGLMGYLPKVLSASLIGIAGVIGGVILRDLSTTAATSAGILYANILGRFIQIVVILLTILIAIDQIGVDVTLLESVLIVVIGALLLGAALAFGLGARISVSNILASYYLQKIYEVGDKVKIGDREGRIIEITPLAVILDSSDGQTCIPAHEFNKESSVLMSREN